MKKSSRKIEDIAASSVRRNAPPRSRLCIALSGGGDSVALLHMLLQSGDSGALLQAVHIEHGIRGERSKEDAAFVRALCDRFSVPLFFFSADIPGMAKAQKQGIESAARAYRRTVFDGLVQSGKTDFILTAHHAQDQAESILLHILRGCGMKGLIGMKERSGYLLRPLLSIDKAEIEAYLTENGLDYCTDETNADTSYDRNYIRHEVMPRLESRFAAGRALLSLSDIAESYHEALRLAASEEDFVYSPGAVGIKTECLEKAGALPSYYVVAALERLNAYEGIERKHIDAVIGLRCAGNGKAIHLKNGVRAVKEYGVVTLSRIHAPEQEALPFCFGMTPFLEGTLTVRAADRAFGRGRTVFDADRVPDSAIFRLRENGDTFTPFGGGGKKLKEYLIDRKIPKRLRDRLPVLADGNKVLMVVGVEIADEIRVTDTTVNAAEAVFEP